MKRAYGATIATAAAVALAAGMTSPASAAKQEEQAADARPSGASAAQPVAGQTAHRITLITGDRVAVDAKGRVTGFERAKGRERIPVLTKRVGGHTLVIPADAQRLIATGKLDQRLFDVTELSKKDNRRAQQKGLKLIVGYKGAAAGARSDVRAAGDTTVRRTLKTLNADAIITPKQDAADLWSALVSGKGDATASGVSRVWLDGVRKASLDKSVPQIGAPKAWAAGFDGKGVKVAVLDTGVDATHPDLKDQVTAEKNFTASADAKDRYGHGTHVASIAAGTGAKSGGKFKGVAPGATLLNGKVLDDGGSGDDSGIIAGMEWAADQGADIVNLSLGGGDTPGVDPLEAEVNKLSAEKGILFAIAAGNDGTPGSVGSPGSADAALTVGAVDDNDKLADFSSQGPRVGDGAIKPDVTAPGVDITAAAAPGSVIDQEVGQKPEGYLTISGTSMATPHVAGAAALLKQQHPDWTYAELKGALTASTKGGKYTPFQQGSGRIAVDKAIKQSVVAEPVSVSFGTQAWPHTDDKPVAKKVTYKNLGKEDVTLDLVVTATNPKGDPAPAGFFKLGAKTVKVPAGGTAAVDLTADSKLGGTIDGAYSAYVVATGGGQSVRTAAAVEREVESYELTLKHIGRDGQAPKYYDSDLEGVSGLATDKSFDPHDASGTVKLRVPKGGYLLNTSMYADPADFTKGADWIAQPKLSVTKDTTVTLDARTTKPVDITVPSADAKSYFASPDYAIDTARGTYSFGWLLDAYTDFRTSHLGPQVTDGSLHQQWTGHWVKGDDAEYDIVLGGKVKQVATGYTKHFKASELATVKANLGASAKGKKGAFSALGSLPGSSGGSSIGIPQVLPGTRTLYLSTADDVKWGMNFEQQAGTDPDGWPIVDAVYSLGAAQKFTGGKSYEKTFNTAVFGPRIGGEFGVTRKGNEIGGYLPLFADGKTHAGSSLYSSVKTTLYKGSTKIGENEDPLVGGATFKVPAAEAEYSLSTSVKRSVKVAAASTRIDASWTFRSKKADNAKLPVSTARFAPAVDLSSKAAAGQTQSVPVTVQGAAAGSNLKSLAVYVSYDYGQTWKKVSVSGGKISVKNPAAGKGISFHAKIADKKGNRSTLSIYNAFYGK
ncbi:S8 family serine peptidase [Streptomyces sp. NBC_01381]|uniref:S8 family peptidase n=1 Tax=Streptomyces sp. NBC_01381 TaxID=2903845 RepID=UPI00225066D6|nr:S8 family serine peptidase [Streptomyces sp. NBC_01381]MCX4669515.1 S8 family serine peptidase [Streptomyces sp. NBC_01381]